MTEPRALVSGASIAGLSTALWLGKAGWNVNIKRVYRIYKELGLQLRNKTPKRRVKAKLRDDRTPATRLGDGLRP